MASYDLNISLLSLPLAGGGIKRRNRSMASYDHRIVDGKEAVAFLVRVKECLEEPQRFILEL